jgi:hypothetical protein
MFLNLLIFVGFVSGVAVFIGLVNAKYRQENAETLAHDSNGCSSCMTGFLCSEVIKAKDIKRG